MPAMTIRPIGADADEEPEVIALWRACGLTRPWNDPAQDLAYALAQPNAAVLVGSIDARIVATAMVGHDGHRGTAYYLAVDPEQRGKSYGRAIMQAAEAWLLERGIWKVNLMIRAGNEPVLQFYDSLGYSSSPVCVVEKWIDPAKRGPA